MPIKKIHRSPTDHVAYQGTTKYDCPYCKQNFETETIQIPIVSTQEEYEAALYNLPVLPWRCSKSRARRGRWKWRSTTFVKSAGCRSSSCVPWRADRSYVVALRVA
jgi:hypothetical protein